MLTTIFSATDFEVLCFADGAALLRRDPRAHSRLHHPGRAHPRRFRPRYPEAAQRPGLSRPDLHHVRPGRHRHGRAGHQATARSTSSRSRFAAAPSSRGCRRRSTPSRAVRRKANRMPPTFHFPGREPLSRREREVLALLVKGASNKEAGRRARHQPAHDRGPPCPHHGEARREERRRPHQDRAEPEDVRAKTAQPRLMPPPFDRGERHADHLRQIGLAIWLCEQQHARSRDDRDERSRSRCIPTCRAPRGPAASSRRPRQARVRSSRRA